MVGCGRAASERGVPFTTAGFRKMVAWLGATARFEYPVHPHQLRHGCGFKLAALAYVYFEGRPAAHTPDEARRIAANTL